MREGIERALSQIPDPRTVLLPEETGGGPLAGPPDGADSALAAVWRAVALLSEVMSDTTRAYAELRTESKCLWTWLCPTPRASPTLARFSRPAGQRARARTARMRTRLSRRQLRGRCSPYLYPGRAWPTRRRQWRLRRRLGQAAAVPAAEMAATVPAHRRLFCALFGVRPRHRCLF